jgi:acetyltransferase-like isoleucine patch superfamily enzyme
MGIQMVNRTAYIISTGKHIVPFEDPVSEVLVKETPLRLQQQQALAEAGFSARLVRDWSEIVARDLPCPVLTDDLFFTSEALRDFLRFSESRVRSTQCAIAESTTFAKTLLPFHPRVCGRIPYPLYYLRDLNAEEFEPVVIDLEELRFPVRIPMHMRGGADVAIPLSTKALVQISHPVDILGANFACLHLRFARTFASAYKKLWLALRAASTRVPKLLAKLNKIGPSCDIHPTACLEGAEIGSGVAIGANAVVRMSHVGDGCSIGDGVVVKHSVVGENSVLFSDVTLGFAVTYPETFLINGPYHLSVFGRESAMFATILDDYRLDGKPIRMEVNGTFLPHTFPFAGSFIGHRTRVAGGSIIAPGRILPNDLLIFPSSSNVLTRIESGLPRNEPLFIQEGGLKPATSRLVDACAK